MKSIFAIAAVWALVLLSGAAAPPSAPEKPAPAPPASASPGPEFVRIVGGDWRWEIQGASAVGDGVGKMTVYYQDIVVTCEKAHVDRQSKSATLSENVVAKYLGSTVTGGMLFLDGATNTATFSGRPTAEDAARGMKLVADTLTIAGASGKSGGRVVNAAGNVVGSGKYESALEASSMMYELDVGRLTIAVPFHGELTAAFVDSKRSPFFGQRLKVDGASLVATQGESGKVDLTAESCTLSSPTGRVTAPNLTGYAQAGQYHLDLTSAGDAHVTGYFAEPPTADRPAVEDNFTCESLTADSASGAGIMMGAVKVWRTGLSLTTDLLTVDRDEGGKYTFKSPGPAKVEFDASALRQKMKDKPAAAKSK